MTVRDWFFHQAATQECVGGSFNIIAVRVCACYVHMCLCGSSYTIFFSSQFLFSISPITFSLFYLSVPLATFSHVSPHRHAQACQRELSGSAGGRQRGCGAI